MGSILQGLFPSKLMRICTRDPMPVVRLYTSRDLTRPTGSERSTDAKETAYNKIKRLILDNAERCEHTPRAA